MVKRLEVLKLTTTAFIDVLAAQRNAQLAEEGLDLAEAAVPATQKRVEAGKAPNVELVRTTTAVATARIQLEQVVSRSKRGRAPRVASGGRLAWRLDVVGIPAIEHFEQDLIDVLGIGLGNA